MTRSDHRFTVFNVTFPPDEHSDPQTAQRRAFHRRQLAWIGAALGVLLLACVGLGIWGSTLDPAPPQASKPKQVAVSAPVAPARATSTPTAIPSAAPRTTPPPAATSTTAPPPAATTAPPSDPNRRTCIRTQDGGAFYVVITSAAAHNFSLCDGAEPFPGDPLDQPDVDRRCLMSNDWSIQHQAIVGVYASTKPEDVAAARAFCRANGGELD